MKLSPFKLRYLFLLLFSNLLITTSAAAQTATFSYQGRLTDNLTPASGTYQMQFALFDAAAGGNQIGSTIENTAVSVSGGVFIVQLDFGPSAFSGAERFLQVSVRRNSGETYFVLSPRQRLTSTPYSQKSISAGAADALSSQCVLCVTDAHINGIDGSKVTGTVQSAAVAQTVAGVVPITNGGTGSTTKNFVDLTTNQTNIAGNKTFTGAVGVTGAGGVFNGNGAGLTNLNGASITSGTVASIQLAADAQPNSISLRMLGSLRWDLLKPELTVPVGLNPYRVTFDGSNMWVSNLSSNAVTKVRASDGSVLGTFNVIANPIGSAFDGANIWVANQNSPNVTKLRASDGALLGNFSVGTIPVAVAFDGANIWVANNNGFSVTKLRASDGATLGTFALGTGPNALAYDGANMWVLCNATTLVKLRASDGANLGSFSVANGTGLVFDGNSIWVANGTNVVKIRSGDGANLGTFPVGSSVSDLVFDGANLWVSSNSGNVVTKMRTSDGAVIAKFQTPGPAGMAFDGANVWVTNTTANTVTRFATAFAQP